MSKSPDIKRVPIVREYSDKTPVLYANDSWVGHTKWELQISFGHLLPFPPGAETAPDAITVRPDVTVVMTFEHAEAFLKALSAQLEKVKKLRTTIEEDESDE